MSHMLGTMALIMLPSGTTRQITITLTSTPIIIITPITQTIITTMAILHTRHMQVVLEVLAELVGQLALVPQQLLVGLESGVELAVEVQ